MARPVLADVSIRGAGCALIQTLTSKAPVVGYLTTFALNADATRKAERLDLWAQYIHVGVDEQDFTDQLATALQGPDAEIVREAVFDSVRAATDAVADAAVPCIARLTAVRLNKGTPDRWVHRDILKLLRGLDAEMIACLRGAIHVLRDIDLAHVFGGGGSITTSFHQDAQDSFIWRVEYSAPGAAALLYHHILNLVAVKSHTASRPHSTVPRGDFSPGRRAFRRRRSRLSYSNCSRRFCRDLCLKGGRSGPACCSSSVARVHDSRAAGPYVCLASCDVLLHGFADESLELDAGGVARKLPAHAVDFRKHDADNRAEHAGRSGTVGPELRGKRSRPPQSVAWDHRSDERDRSARATDGHFTWIVHSNDVLIYASPAKHDNAEDAELEARAHTAKNHAGIAFVHRVQHYPW